MKWYQWRTTALRLAGGGTAIAAAMGVFCVRNSGLVHEWRICSFPVGCNYVDGSVSPLPTTSVTLPDGSALGIELYACLVIALGVLVAVAALVCAQGGARLGWRFVLCGVAVLLACCLVCFRLPQPARLTGVVGPCITTSSCPMEMSPYPSAIPSVWYVIPAAMLGLLSAGLGLL